ncbi:hypothetical protein [Taibaiella sp. KBW10]|uniref:hypothetical protein n=1 Tax=Taibaiella sp. KBW10 TaxID=2153357 RepID=UPI000F59DB28|nr:hypothetical protein [Taibaiella sp. KBW10]
MSATNTKTDNCIRDKDGNFLSCYYASAQPEWVTDFNGDGIADALFHFMDEGLGGGGNAFGYEYRIVLLDQAQKIQKQYALFGGGKMSYGQLNINRVHNGKIEASYEENQFLRGNYEDTLNLKSEDLVFSLEGDRIVEAHYHNCPMAMMKKQIFKTDKGLKIEKDIASDDQYNEECTESITMPDRSQYTAILGGCEELSLHFSRTIAYDKRLETNKAFIKQTLLEELLFLKEHTLYPTVIKAAYDQVQKTQSGSLTIEQYGGVTLHLNMADHWQAHLFISGNAEQGSFLTLRFVKAKAGETMAFWESMDNKMKLKPQKKATK